MSSFASRCSSLILALFVLALISLTVAAQSITGSISGTVTDANGGVINGSAVSLVND